MTESPPKLRYDSDRIFLELTDWERDAGLLEAVRACIAVQRSAGEAALRAHYRPNPQAQQEVSEAALERILASGTNVNDIVEDRELSNCLAFNFSNVQDAVISREVTGSRRRADALVTAKLLALFENSRPLTVRNSGHFWYPPGGFMGWHTNLRTPGWRLYINYVEEPGRSFFRYRDPETGRIVTALDRMWNFRLFRITAQQPLWHAVYSDTHRFSLGYKVSATPSLAERVQRKWRRWRGTA
jgi:hypothetical protein